MDVSDEVRGCLGYLFGVRRVCDRRKFCLLGADVRAVDRSDEIVAAGSAIGGMDEFRLMMWVCCSC